MNFIWFLLAIVLFYFLYWYALSLIIFLPSMPLIGFIGYLEENAEKRWAKIALIPTFILAFVLGTFLPCAIFGMGMGVTVLNFVEEATYPIIYFLIAGFGAFTISAPSGESSFPGMIISLTAYIITVTISKFSIFSEITIDLLMSIFWVGSGLLLLIGVVFLIIGFLDEKISKRSENKIEIQQESKKKLTLGVYIISILFIVLGGLWVVGFLFYPSRELLGYFIWGAPLLVGGIGMLKRKYWALRLSQIVLVLSALQGIIMVLIVLFRAKEFDIFPLLIWLFVFFVFFGLPMWFLFKRSTVAQFIKLNTSR